MRPRKIIDLIKIAPPSLWRLSNLRGHKRWKCVKLWSDQTRMMFQLQEKNEGKTLIVITFQTGRWVFHRITSTWRSRVLCLSYEACSQVNNSIMTWLVNIFLELWKQTVIEKKYTTYYLWKSDSLKDEFLGITVIQQKTKKAI